MLKPLAAACLAALSLVACSEQGSFSGTWKIEKADPAPWIGPDFKLDSSFSSEYVGKTVVFEPTKIVAPELLACENPNYEFAEVPAEGLFQGGLAPAENQAAKAEAAARKLGFETIPVHTMTTSCEHDIAFHMRDKDHAAFALNNMIFWMVRQP